ncbi:hypothetical protein [Pseudescherichia sp.]|uniref:hypothetical protein n=1 Tax=Pseudescherichia sp. TaxID=2055881 RepID=UPI00289CC9C5|nr:hypothetical protein [Pseudescherichia sp.]
MSQELSFILTLRDLSVNLYLLKDDASIDEIKKWVIINHHLLPDEKYVIDFVNKLIEISEKNASMSEVDDFLVDVSHFWISYVTAAPLDFIYAGKRSSEHIIESVLSEYNIKCNGHIYTDDEVDLASLDHQGLSELNRPVLLCDNSGLSYFNKNHFIGYLNIERFDHSIINSEHITNTIKNYYSMAEIINENYQTLRKDQGENIRKVILGSSYAYYGVPDSLLCQSVNLSIASGDASYNHALIKHCHEKYGIKNYVVVLGYFELFHELSKGLNGYFYLAKQFFKINNIKYDYRARSNKLKNENIFTSYSNPMEYVLKEFIPHFMAAISLTSAQEKFTNSNSSTNKKIINNFSYSDTQTTNETQYFSKFYNTDGVAEFNKIIFSKMTDFIREINGNIFFVIQPFLPLFNERYHKEMRDETLTFFDAISDGESTFFIDLSSDMDFTPEDFFDAHHMNFQGAQKLYHKLKWLKL